MHLALFDFDGTITVNDSFIKFIRFAVGDAEFILGMMILSPVLVVYKLRLISNDKAKQMVLSYFFKGMSRKEFQDIAQDYSFNHIDSILRPEAIQKIVWHKEQGHAVVVVSASIACWLKPWCDKNGLNLIATKLEMKEDIITGKFLTNNCYGAEKVYRVKKTYNLNNYEYIYAYGDSKGDRELLELANEYFYKPFRQKNTIFILIEKFKNCLLSYIK